MTTRFEQELDKKAEEWCEKFSSPGDFEEFGQAEAFHAGAIAAINIYEPLLKEAMESLDKITKHHGFDSSTPGEIIALSSNLLAEKTLASIREKFQEESKP